MNSAATDTYAQVITDELERALGETPFFRQWAPMDPGPSRTASERYRALPHLTKRDIRAHMPKGFVPQSQDYAHALRSGEVELVATSGTTEERSSILWHQPWWDASEHAAASLHTGLDQVINGTQREAVLTTPLCAGTVCHVGDLPLAERTMGRLLFLNQQPDPARWSSLDMDRMIRELDDFKPQLLEADPAYLAILCRYAADLGRPLCCPEFISLTYEFPSRLHYAQIRRAYPQTPLLSSYGSTETGHLLTECEQGRFHQNTGYCHLEIEPLKSFHAQPGVGRLLVTTLHHPWVHLLRFDIGDMVRLDVRPCPCGRTEGLTVERILGRVRDLTFTTTGRAVTVNELDQAMAPYEELLQYQLEQTSATEYLFHFVMEAGRHDAPPGILKTLQSVYGPGSRITVRRESGIPAEASGKFRLGRTTFSWHADELFSRETLSP